MKISDEMRFPHPVLYRETHDYQTGEFEMKVRIAEHPEKSTLSLEYDIVLTEPTIRAKVEEGRAAAGFYVTCQDTYFTELMELSLQTFRLDFEPGKLSGRVVIRPMVWSKTEISHFSTENCHKEYGDHPLNFENGTILALSDEIIINVGKEKLSEMETIFALAKSDDLEKNTFDLDLENERITVLIAPNIYETVNRLRGLKHGRAIILNSVFLPAVMETLANVRDNSEAYADKRWYQIFSAKCDFLNINMEDPDPWADAQTLLELPFRQVDECREILGD